MSWLHESVVVPCISTSLTVVTILRTGFFHGSSRCLKPFHSLQQVFVAPPLYRRHPLWFNQNLAQIATRFSTSMTAITARNLNLLPSFISQDLLPDGVFLTPVSGLHYVLHVFDQTQSMLDAMGSSSDVQLNTVKEAVRVHDDRITYLESKQSDTKKQVSLKVAIDSEFKDWLTNQSEEDWLTIMGLKRLSGDLQSRDWQVAAQRQVSEFLRSILKINRVNLDFKVITYAYLFSLQCCLLVCCWT